MAKQSEAWKSLERNAAKKLGGKRILRGGNFAVSDCDIFIEEHPELKLDCKWSGKGFRHHSLLKEIVSKYCKKPESIPVLITKGRNERGEVVSVPIEHYAELLKIKAKFKRMVLDIAVGKVAD